LKRQGFCSWMLFLDVRYAAHKSPRPVLVRLCVMVDLNQNQMPYIGQGAVIHCTVTMWTSFLLTTDGLQLDVVAPEPKESQALIRILNGRKEESALQMLKARTAVSKRAYFHRKACAHPKQVEAGFATSVLAFPPRRLNLCARRAFCRWPS